VTSSQTPISAPIRKLFDDAVQRHQAGRLGESERLYRGILAADPKHPGSLHLLGVIAHQMGRSEIAVNLIFRAISLNKGVAAYHSNRGNALKDLGRIDEALAAYDNAILLKPDFAEAHTNRGIALKDLGRIDEALASCDAAIRLKPDFAEAHSNRGNALKDLGRIDEALAAWDAAVHFKPDFAEAHSNRGNALKELGRLDEAVESCDAAIRLKLDYAEAHYNRGIALKELGRSGEAMAAYRTAISLKPDLAEAHSARGIALKDRGLVDEALAGYETAIRLKPDFAEAHSMRGILLKELGRIDEALAAWDAAIRLKPDFVEAHSNRGIALKDLDRLDEALAAYDAAIRFKPDFAEAHSNRGIALKDLGRLDEALAAYDTAIRLKPDFAEAYSNRGAVLKDLGRIDEALTDFDAAIRLKPDFAEAHSNRGVALKDLGHIDEALAAWDDAAHLQPDYAEAHYNRGIALKDLGRLDEAMAAYDTSIHLEPDFADAHSNRLMSMHYWDCATAGDIFAAAREYGARFDGITGSPSPAAGLDPERRLRLGYVSGDLGAHPVGYFLAPVLANHDRSQVEIFCYSALDRRDDLALRLRSFADHWRTLVGLSDEEAAARIRADAIDILVDLSGHTAHNRLRMFALRPAPVQVTWMGYFGTTGLASMDAILADRFVVREGEETSYVERVHRLPDSYLCFSPPDLDVAIDHRLEAAQPVTFGSFNNHAKTSPSTIALWARLLTLVAESRLLLKNQALCSATARQELLRQFSVHGIGPERLLLEEAVPRADLLAAYNRVDIALDPTPYGGGTTTVEALWMGVPVVTLRGQTWVGRVSESILSTVGLPELVATSPDDYVEIAAGLAKDGTRLKALRSGLRARLEGSPLCDGPSFTRHIEAAFRGMWRGWCAAGNGDPR